VRERFTRKTFSGLRMNRDLADPAAVEDRAHHADLTTAVMVDLKAAGERLAQLRIFARIRAFASSASCSASGTPASSASSIARADFE
jgi:hypothetical protein